MPEFSIDGTVRSITRVKREKKDTESDKMKIIVMNEEGDRVDVQGKPSLLQGLKPEEQLVVSFKRTQKTIAEAITEEKTKKKK